MSPWRIIALVLGATTFAMPGLSFDDPAHRFVSDVAVLSNLQDAAAAGNRNSMSEQRQLLASIRTRYEAPGAEIEPSPSTISAMIVYVLSGGSPIVADRFAKSERLTDDQRLLIESVSRFMQGGNADKLGPLGRLDPLTFPSAQAGRLALAQAMLLADKDPRKQELFAIAIGAMPGTLVEESALRRSAASAANAGRATLLWRRCERYLRRFGKSVFAPEFVGTLPNLAVEVLRNGGELRPLEVDIALTGLPVIRRRAAYMNLARLATGADQTGLVQFAARRARRLSVAGSREDLSAKVYSAIHEVVGKQQDEAVAALQSIDATRLPPLDRALLHAALKVSAKIVELPEDLPPGLLPPPSVQYSTPDLENLNRQAQHTIEVAGAVLEDSRK